ncbi:MAG: CvpA family protein [Asticcacaulis sp.]
MTLYDLIFLAMLAVLGFTGVMRGGIRSLIDLVAFFLAFFVAAISMGFMRQSFHLDIVTGYVAAVIVFVAILLIVRYLGHSLSDAIHKQKALGIFDRILGGALGILASLFILGLFHLAFSLVTPIDRQPSWFREAKVYPLSVRSAKAIQALLPQGTGLADKVAPAVEN